MSAQGRPGMGPEFSTLDGELGLVAAIVHQVLADARSSRADRRAEALRFIADPEQGLAWWDRTLGMEGRLLRLTQTVLRQRQGDG